MTIRRSLGWSFTEEIGKKVLHFGGSVVIARLLTPAEMGVFALAMAVYGIIGAVQQFGISSYLVREAELNADKIRSAFGVWFVVCGVLAVVVLAGRHAVADMYDTPGIAAVLLIVAMNFLLTPFGEPARALLMRDMRFDLLNHINLTSAALKLGATIGLAVLGWGYMALAWGMLIGTAAQAGMLLAVRPDHLSMRPSLGKWREITRFGGWLTGASIAGTITKEGQKFVLGGLISPAAVALFDRAVQVPSLFRMSILHPITRVLFPALADDIRNGRSVGQKVELLIAANTMLVWPAFAVTAVVAEPLIVFVFGAQWRVAGEILPYLLLAQGVLTILPQPEQILVAYGRVKRLFGLRLFAVFNGLSFAAVGALHSLAMVAYLRPAAAGLFVTVLAFAMFRFMEVPRARLLVHYARALATAGLCALPALYMVSVHGPDALPVQVLGAFAAAGPIWLFALFALQHPLAPEILRIADRARQRLIGRARGASAGGG